MRITILHNEVASASTPDDRDVLIQAEAVRTALAALGHPVEILPCTLDLAQLRQRLEIGRPDLVFNLVESLAGTGRLIHLAPSLLDAMGLPYTGSCTESIQLTSHKILAKDRLRALGLPTPDWGGPFPPDLPAVSHIAAAAPGDAGRWIVKSLWEHASIGLDETSIVLCDRVDQMPATLRDRASGFGGACFAERFVEGREFNLSLLAGSRGPEVLRPAEILFEGYPPDALHIVGYRAKWDVGSYEYHHTPRRFDFPPADAALLGRLQVLALRCWQGFGLNGYARVDVRVDRDGNPWVLEVNTNPCLSPDAGFAAALEASGVRYPEAIERILADTRRTCSLGTSVEPEASATNSLRPPSRSRIRPKLRLAASPRDPAAVRRLVEATGYFTRVEADVAEELVNERLSRGPASGYHFVFAELDEKLAGYACYGPVPMTVSSYDLYWIVVSPEFQGKGVGRILLEETERLARQSGGTRLYADTSGRAQYGSTRAFYDRVGFRREALLEDFYALGDAKVIYSKPL
ncbi:MAG: GNAT family N-acetyltransferase [Desulfobacterales bacterium]|jgi:D-alanine-D-alanine ligase|nr:GNAT family N-acetyltransferase [Desulfobacterales bacterium]